jgi:ketosteroid isomerase-like protein
MKSFPKTLALLLLLISIGVGQKPNSSALMSLVETERAFAKMSVERDVREAFLKFFADDGINFQPHPTKTREVFLKRPPPAGRPTGVLNWAPVYADVAQAGDLGYTTGPFTFVSNSSPPGPTRYGFYFSIWKKQSDGSWKVALDCGIQTPDHSQQKFEFKAAPQTRAPKAPGAFDAERGRASLLDLDRSFQNETRTLGTQRTYLKYLSADARLHRNDVMPLVGLSAIQSYLDATKGEFTAAEPIKADVSQSDDLGYTYGSYELRDAGVKGSEKGYYVRVWKRDTHRKWKLVLDTLSPIPPQAK